MSPNATVRIWFDTTVSAYRMTSPFNKELVTALKQIPASDRSYAPDSKIWTFTEKYLDGILSLCKTVMGVTPQLVTRAQAEKAQAGQTQGHTTAAVPRGASPMDSTILTFFRLLPYEAALAAYRKAAVVYHPDHQGDVAKMSDLNVCWQRIEKDLFSR